MAPPPPPDVAQSHLLERLGLLLPKQMTPCEDTITTNSSIGGSSGFSSYANGDHTSDVGSLSPSPAHGNTTRFFFSNSTFVKLFFCHGYLL